MEFSSIYLFQLFGPTFFAPLTKANPEAMGPMKAMKAGGMWGRAHAVVLRRFSSNLISVEGKG